MPVVTRPPRPSSLPTTPAPYHQLLRGPRRRWWRPLIALALALPGVFLFAALAVVPFVVAAVIWHPDDIEDFISRQLDVATMGPAGFIYLNATLIGLIPAAVLSIWIAHGVRPGYVSSVAGRIRWKWLLRCVLTLLPLWAIYIGVGVLVERGGSPRPESWPALLVIVLVLTPLQAAGEEYFFRGWIMQNVGSFFARPIVGVVVSVTVSSAAFALAHGSFDPWVVGSLVCFAAAAGIATWRTGGLEAAIVLHAVNNILTFGVVLLFGGWQEAFVSEQSKGTPAVLVAALVGHGAALALVLWQARRAGVQPLYQPTARPISAPPGVVTPAS